MDGQVQKRVDDDDDEEDEEKNIFLYDGLMKCVLDQIH
jgi:hypothetical protein